MGIVPPTMPKTPPNQIQTGCVIKSREFTKIELPCKWVRHPKKIEETTNATVAARYGEPTRERKFELIAVCIGNIIPTRIPRPNNNLTNPLVLNPKFKTAVIYKITAVN